MTQARRNLTCAHDHVSIAQKKRRHVHPAGTLMPEAPRWHRLLTDLLLSQDKNAAYTLSTVLSTPSGPVPSSRSVIHRGTLLLPRPAAAAPLPLLLTTTDIRTPKAHQLHANPSAAATFWFATPQVQVRLAATAHLLPHPAHPWRAAFPAETLGDGQGSGGTDDRNGHHPRPFDWEAERLRVFDELSGHLRASFVTPVPGTPMAAYDDAAQWPQTAPPRGQGDTAEQQVVDGALANFALVVLDPDKVEVLELAPLPNRRTGWTRRGDGWVEQIVVP